MPDDVDWGRLMPAIVQTVIDLRFKWTDAGRKIGVGEGVVRTYFDRFDRGDWKDFSPRGRNRQSLLEYAAETWPDWRERFATAPTEGAETDAHLMDLGKKALRGRKGTTRRGRQTGTDDQ